MVLVCQTACSTHITEVVGNAWTSSSKSSSNKFFMFSRGKEYTRACHSWSVGRMSLFVGLGTFSTRLVRLLDQLLGQPLLMFQVLSNMISLMKKAVTILDPLSAL